MPPVCHLTLFVSSQGTVISLLRLDISTIHWQRKRHMMLFPVLLSNLQRLSTAFEKKKNTQSAVFISILSDFNRARDVAKRPGDVCSATTEAERRPRTFEPRRGSKTRKRISIRISFSCSFESARRDSNPRPRPWQGRAPPTEPLAHILLYLQVLMSYGQLV